jgi:hypothetical protein
MLCCLYFITYPADAQLKMILGSNGSLDLCIMTSLAGFLDPPRFLAFAALQINPAGIGHIGKGAKRRGASLIIRFRNGAVTPS